MFYFDLLICSLSIIFWIYLIYSTWEVAHHRPPFVPSPYLPRKIVTNKISELINKANHTLTIVDAGCGNGKILYTLAKKHPQHHFIGIEYNQKLYKYCCYRYQKINNLKFHNQDLLQFNYNTTNIVYYFGLPYLTHKFEKILFNTKTELDIFTLDAQFQSLHLINKYFFKFWITQSYVYHYKNHLEK